MRSIGRAGGRVGRFLVLVMEVTRKIQNLLLNLIMRWMQMKGVTAKRISVQIVKFAALICLKTT